MPPTPPTPFYYEDASRPNSSPTIRLVLDTQSPEQVLVTAQHLQSSPGSLVILVRVQPVLGGLFLRPLLEPLDHAVAATWRPFKHALPYSNFPW